MASNPTSGGDPLSQASLWSRFWFAWNKPLLDLGRNRALDASDLPILALEDQSRFNRQYIEDVWRTELEKCGKPNLALALARDFFNTTWTSRILIMLNSLAKIGQAMALGKLLETLEETRSNDDRVTSSGYFWAAAIIFCGCVAFPTKQHSFFQLYRKGSQYRLGMTATIYAKTLRLPSIGSSVNAGHVTNLASNDVERFLLTSIYFNILLASPVEIITVLMVGIFTIGPVFCCGYALLLILVPLQFWLSHRFVVLRSKISKLTDARVSLVSQAVAGARVLKLQGWELEIERKIKSLRSQEVRQLRRTNRLKAWNDAIYYVSSLVVANFVFGIHVGILGGTLTPRIVFTTFTLWNLLQYSVTKHIPHAIMGLSECYVSCQRIQTFLEQPEKRNDHEPTVLENSGNGSIVPLISLQDVTCYWGEPNADESSSRKVAVKNVSLQFQPGTLYCVIGKVGSGKSALLQTLISELPVARGKVFTSYRSMSYAPQDPWIMDGTARENITMGLEWNHEWYQKIVQSCCLESDFQQFQRGDETVVGDRGVQCSGGQKARLALARAMYSDADVLILDDPLSAVDAKVARSIYCSAIQKLCTRRGKCVILVTHQHQFVGGKENICILLEQGSIACCGSFDDCVAKSGEGLATALQTDHNAEEHSIEHDTLEEAAEAQNVIKKIERAKVDVSMMENRKTGIIEFRTWRYYVESLGGMLISSAFLFMFVATQALFLVTVYFVARWAEEPEITQRSFPWFALVYGLTIGTVCVASVRAHVSFHLFLQASKRLHNRMLRSVLRATIEFYDTNPLGRVLNRFAADVGISDELLPITLYEFGVGSVMFLGSIITAVSVVPLTLLIFPFLLWAFVSLKNTFVQTTRELKRLEGLGRSPIYAMMSESLLGIATIRANQKADYFGNKFETLHDKLIRVQFAFIGCSRWFATKLDFLSFLFLASATLCSVLVQEQGWLNVDPSVLGLALSLLLQLAGANFPFMVRQSAEVTNHMVSIERIWEYGNNISQEAAFETEFDKQHSDWPKTPSIEVSRLQARYRGGLPTCLRNVSFVVRPGERVGVVGRTGAGKTSLVQALFRVLEAEEGSVEIGGVDISKLGLHKLRTNMAVITQSPVLFSGCTIRENLDPYPKDSDAKQLARLEVALRDVHMWESVQTCPSGIEALVTESGTNFSVGQRQLLCLARAILANCKILVLDEATANVDKQTDHLLQETLRERFRDATVIAIAHRLDTVMDYDKILVLGNGEVLEFGRPVDLLNNKHGHFASMVESTGHAMANELRLRAR